MLQNSGGWRSSTIAAKLLKKNNELRSYGLNYVLRKFFWDHFYKQERLYLLRRDLNIPLPTFIYRKRGNKEIRFLSDKDGTEGFASLLPEHVRHMRGLLNDGVRCAATFVDDAIVAYLWMMPGGLYDRELHYQVDCAPSEILQGVYVHPDYRGSSVLLELLEYGWEYYQRQGFNSVLGIVLESNRPSIRMHQRVGFVETGQRLRTYKLASLHWTRAESYQGKCLFEDAA